MTAFIIAAVGGEEVLTTTVKQLADRVRPTFNPAAATSRPVVPERTLRDRRGLLRDGCVADRSVARASGARNPRRLRRRYRRCGRREPRAARRPLGVRRDRGSRTRLGVVRRLRDRFRRPHPTVRRRSRDGRPCRGPPTSAVAGRSTRESGADGQGYAEGSAVEERLAALERGGDDLDAQLDAGRAAVYGSTEEQPEQHFIGWLDDVDPDALFASGEAWGLQVVRRKDRQTATSAAAATRRAAARRADAARR